MGRALGAGPAGSGVQGRGDPRQPVNLPLNTVLVVYTGSTLGPAYEGEQGEPPVDPSVSGLLFFMYMNHDVYMFIKLKGPNPYRTPVWELNG